MDGKEALTDDDDPEDANNDWIDEGGNTFTPTEPAAEGCTTNKNQKVYQSFH